LPQARQNKAGITFRRRRLKGITRLILEFYGYRQ
jgi:hypothetical protein